jgi:glutathione synthase/RimK-type ligase-like ATP-grasp enzyme
MINKKTKKISLFSPMILSRHPSHNVLRLKNKNIRLLPYRSVIRFGSTTECNDTIDKGGQRIEINSIQSIKNSASKLRMKKKFMEAGVRTAEWYKHIFANGLHRFQNQIAEQEIVHTIEDLPYPIVAKAHFGSKGKGNTLLKTFEEFTQWKEGKTLSNYIFEKFMNYALEYRLHVTEDGCFYTCRKALKTDVPEDQKWRRHDDICVWFLEDNPEFKKPASWNDIETDCVKALKSIGADILSFDVKVQSAMDSKGNNRPYQDYILLECNSASSMDNGTGEISKCAQKYIEIIPKVIINKAKKEGLYKIN